MRDKSANLTVIPHPGHPRASVPDRADPAGSPDGIAPQAEPWEMLATHLRASVAPIADYLGCSLGVSRDNAIDWLARSGGCPCSQESALPCPAICGSWRRRAESRVVSCDDQPLGAVWHCSMPESIRLRSILDGLIAAAEKQVECERRDRSFATEIAFGSQIQQDLLIDRMPFDLGFAQAALTSIASRDVGGDFIEIFPRDDSSIDVLIGDVMGKGIKAAMLGAALHRRFSRALYRTRSGSAAGPDTVEPREIVAAVSREVTPRLIDYESFVTLCLARFDASRHRLDFVHCGHMPIIHYRRVLDRCVRLRGESMPLGFSLAESHTQCSVAFEAGDIILFYTDGLTEARNSRGDLFGIARLEDIIQANSQRDAEGLIRVVHESVVDFRGGPCFDDDLTCGVVKISGDSGTPRPIRVFAEARSDLSELVKIRDFVRQVGARHSRPPLDEERLDLLTIAVNEAASNIMIHSHDPDCGTWIRLAGEIHADRVAITLSHAGKPFDPTVVPPPRFDGSSEGGFGVYLIKNCVENVTYACDEMGTNQITLVKLRGPHPTCPEPRDRRREPDRDCG
jgi:phosphoserine phosphatase RsbU/P